MVVSGNDHLNDSNYCNCAAIEHYSRFQIDNGTNGVLWVWYVRAVWGWGDRTTEWWYYIKRKRTAKALSCFSSSYSISFSSPVLPGRSPLLPLPPLSLPPLTPLTALLCFALLISLLHHAPPTPFHFLSGCCQLQCGEQIGAVRDSEG